MAILPCALVDCEESATHVVAETDPLNLLFASGAGLCCEKHAKELCQVGGIVLTMDGFAEAVRKEAQG